MIYFFDNYDLINLEKADEILPQKRAEKFHRLKSKRDRQNCLGAYLLLRRALSEHGIEDFEIILGENEKPFLKNNSDFFFNISHCENGIALALAKSPVGIDIQDIKPCNYKVMKRVYSDEETSYVINSDDIDRAFTRIWTLKESAVKCDGKTLANLKDYFFGNEEKSFNKFGKNFETLEEKNLIISVCGYENFYHTNQIKIVEDLQ